MTERRPDIGGRASSQSPIRLFAASARLNFCFIRLLWHDLLAREPGGPKVIDRMASYVRQAKPHSEETLVDKMLAIKAEIW